MGVCVQVPYGSSGTLLSVRVDAGIVPIQQDFVGDLAARAHGSPLDAPDALDTLVRGSFSNVRLSELGNDGPDAATTRIPSWMKYAGRAMVHGGTSGDLLAVDTPEALLSPT